ncbi:MAG TPA: ATP-binding cassette domain-containing protein [Firmicutes bacterium]|nr:ATP-binding cassette domain-containing protein [Bacillota bacterium]
MSKILLEVSQLQKYYAERCILSVEHLRIYAGDRIGVVGVNGSGKTTLLNLLSGQIQPDSGQIRRYGSIAFLEQFGQPAGQTDGLAQSLMGVSEKQADGPLSGGERMRFRIAEAFGQQASLLFADEPTSNLDDAGIEQFCEQMETVESFLLISHDRAVLRRLCTKILEVDGGRIQCYPGGYDFYLAEKRRQEQEKRTAYEKYCLEKEHLLQALADRTERAQSVRKAPSRMGNSEARLHKRAAGERQEKLQNATKSIESRLARLEVQEKPKENIRISFDFSLTDPPENKIVLRCQNLSFSYPGACPSHTAPLFEGASFVLERGSKTILYGKNGAGKTTLMNLIADGHPAIQAVPKVKFGYFRQGFEQIDFSKTVLENAMAGSVQTEGTMRNMLARLLIRRDDVYKQASVLSGGERIKLAFAMLFGSAANVLLLDEPTNYLDTESIAVLQEMVQNYEGTVLFVSHDRDFADSVATHTLVLEDRRILSFSGTPSAFLESRKPKEEKPMEEAVLSLRLTETISLLSRPNLSAEEKERLEAEYAVLLQQKQKLRQNPAKKNKRPLPSH